MFGLKFENGKYIFKVAADTEQLYLNLYRGERLKNRIAFDPEARIGDVWSMELSGDLSGLSYAYEADGVVFSDPNGTVFAGRSRFGMLQDGTRILKTPVAEALSAPEYDADWEKDKPLDIPYEDSVIYRLHVRGFTKHASSGVAAEARGTFCGVVEKLPYLKALGVTAIELMPAYEFNEIMLQQFGGGDPHKPEPQPTGRLNYWGFTPDALMKAPKAGYTPAKKNPRDAFRALVMACHAQGLELILDLYFTRECTPDHVISVIRYWRVQYHIDGVHLIGDVPLAVISRDPYLSRFKIWADSFAGSMSNAAGQGRHRTEGAQKKRYLADYNPGFQNDMRRILKGDEDMLETLMQRVRENPPDRAVIHYLANAEGFSLMDVVSYDRKHNDENGERNQDGTDENYSWNCGEEGATRKKKLQALRRQQLRNAWLLLLLSQGTPLIQAGDEFGHSRQGNNNAYCQDNRINWLDWRLVEQNRELHAFVKQALAFRKQHGVFRQSREPQLLDYRNTGLPDVSYHGENAWRPETERFRRQLGVMYNGAYASDDSFLVLYNFHWEPHSFSVPNPPKGFVWALCIDTTDEAYGGFYPEGQEAVLKEKDCLVQARSILVLKAVKNEAL